LTKNETRVTVKTLSECPINGERAKQQSRFLFFLFFTGSREHDDRADLCISLPMAGGEYVGPEVLGESPKADALRFEQSPPRKDTQSSQLTRLRA
jgi:hypothetical protein